MKFRNIILASAAVLLAACNEIETTEPVPVPEAISVAPEYRAFPSGGGVAEVVVLSTGEWTLEGESDWLVPSVRKGADKDIVTFEAGPNTGGEQLDAKFVFRMGELEAEFTAIQYAKPEELLNVEVLSEKDNIISFKEGYFEILVKSDFDYRDLEVVVEGEDATWLSHSLSIELDPTKAVSTDVRICMSVQENAGTEKREARITVVGGDVRSESVSLCQMPRSFIEVAKAAYFVEPAAGTLEIPVSANVEYDVTLSEGAFLEYKGNAGGKLSFLYGASDSPRTCEVTLVQKEAYAGEEPVSLTIPVTQKQASLISTALKMSGARVIPSWTDSDMFYYATEITLEMLFCADEFDHTIHTLAGREGKLLVRVGDAGKPANQLQVLYQSSGRANYDILSKDNILLETGRWYHLAVVFSTNDDWAGNIKVYLDGELIKDYSHSSNVRECDWSRSFYLGYSYEVGRDFNGMMSEVRIWKRCLTKEEINAEGHFYKIDNPEEDETLAVYWKLNEGEGYEIRDWSKYGNNARCEINLEKQGDNVVGENGANWADVSLP